MRSFIDAAAQAVMVFVMSKTASAEERRVQFELVAERLACTRMLVHIEDETVSVWFPTRPRVH